MHDNPARPRALFTLWMAFHDRLGKKERLHRFGFIDNNHCIFYNHPETLQHLLFSCHEAHGIWQHALKWLQVLHTPEGWIEELVWIIGNLKEKEAKGAILKCAFVETIYKVWKHISSCCFGSVSSRNIAPKIIDNVIYRCWLKQSLGNN